MLPVLFRRPRIHVKANQPACKQIKRRAEKVGARIQARLKHICAKERQDQQADHPGAGKDLSAVDKYDADTAHKERNSKQNRCNHRRHAEGNAHLKEKVMRMHITVGPAQAVDAR